MIEFFSEQCPWYVAGPLMGFTVVLFQWLSNYALGMTGAIGGFADWVRSPRRGWNWQAAVFVGVAAGAALYGLFTGRIESSWNHGSFDSLLQFSFVGKAIVLLIGGVLVGFGARMAGGCTSGNGLCGIGRGSPASLVATATFCVTAIITAFLIQALSGGHR